MRAQGRASVGGDRLGDGQKFFAFRHIRRS
jgi:hypothetical protein